MGLKLFTMGGYWSCYDGSGFEDYHLETRGDISFEQKAKRAPAISSRIH